MRAHTQTRIHSEEVNGDCWATAIECILDLPLGTLPRWEAGRAGSSYRQDVMVYLAHHQGVWSHTVQATFFSVLRPVGLHLINGGSPRFASIGHCVVGDRGVRIHDPHPDRTFLDGEKEWQFFAPIPEEARSWYRYLELPCPCGCGAGVTSE